MVMSNLGADRWIVLMNLLMKELENVLDTGLRGDGAIWLIVAGGIVRRLAHLLALDNAVFADQHESLTPFVTKSIFWSRMIHEHADCFRELAPRVGKERDQGAIHLLILCPGLHHRTIVHAIHKHLINPSLLQLSSFFQIARHLLPGSARSESTWQA